MPSDHLYFIGVRDRPLAVGRAPGRSMARRAPEPECVDEFFTFVFSLVGLDATAYRGSALDRRIPACLRFLRVKDLSEARRKLSANPQLVSGVLNGVLLGVTEFCRDRGVFTQIRQMVLPYLLRLDHSPRIWSAACSDGRELYSVAALLREADALSRAHLLGSDCRPDALDLARHAEYPGQILEELPASWHQHFRAGRHGVRMTDDLRASVCWKQADLLAGSEPGPWDLILWRNMAIYLAPAAVERVWRSLISELAPGGFLVAGKAESPPRGFGLEKVGPCIFRKSFTQS